MNSRDRLSKGELRAAIEYELEDVLRNHVGLRNLKESRRREETESKLADSKPLEDVLESILKQAPNLANLFLLGKRASNPFKTKEVQEKEIPFDGQRFPSYFKFKGKDYGTELHRETHKNMRARIIFETDVVNDYFSRSIEAGAFSLSQHAETEKKSVTDFAGPNLHNGIATLSVKIPDSAAVGDELTFEAIVSDPANGRNFENRFIVRVKEAAQTGGGGGGRKKPSSKSDGKGRENQAGILLSNIIEVTEDQWAKHEFDKHTALVIKDAGSPDDGNGDDTPTQYDFFINVDNVYLKAEMKPAKSDVPVLKARFIYGNVLVGLGLLQQQIESGNSKNGDSNGDEEPANIEERVAQVSRALSPIILPMIDSLGALDLGEMEAVTASGEAV